MPAVENTVMILALWAILGYFLGSIPFGLLLAKGMKLGNLREIGSGNIGATNVLRTGNKTAAVLTLLCDALKGAAAVCLARYYGGEDAAQLAGFMSMIGHCFPVWLRFQGGKGVATFLGVMLAYAPIVGLGCCLAWLLAALLSRISSMGALAAALVSSLLLVFTGHGAAFVMGFVLTILIFVRHHGNIRRIRAGTEPKIGEKKR